MYFAIIGDIISSKKISDRGEQQEKLRRLLEKINDRYSDSIASKFLITLGDEFQGLLRFPGQLPEIIDCISFAMHPVEIRFGVGIGEISTEPVNEVALGDDGSAYHYARRVIDELKIRERRNRSYASRVMYCCADEEKCRLLNAVSAGQYFIERQWTDKQREIAELMLVGESKTQEGIAKMLGITQSSVNSRLKASGCYDYLYMREAIAGALGEGRKEK